METFGRGLCHIVEKYRLMVVTMMWWWALAYMVADVIKTAMKFNMSSLTHKPDYNGQSPHTSEYVFMS